MDLVRKVILRNVTYNQLNSSKYMERNKMLRLDYISNTVVTLNGTNNISPRTNFIHCSYMWNKTTKESYREEDINYVDNSSILFSVVSSDVSNCLVNKYFKKMIRSPITVTCDPFGIPLSTKRRKSLISIGRVFTQVEPN